MCAKSLQLCPALCDPMDCSPPGSSVHGIPQARIPEWVAMPSSKGSAQCRDLPNTGIEPLSLRSAALASEFFTSSATWEAKTDAAAAAAKSLQSCPTLCDRIDGSPPGTPRPWDSPGKNTGVGCHFLLQSMKVKSENEVAQSCLTLSDLMDCSLPGSSIHGIFQARVLELGAIAFSKTDASECLITKEMSALKEGAGSVRVHNEGDNLWCRASKDSLSK